MTTLTDEQKTAIVTAIRTAVMHQMQRWDAERDAEMAVGVDVELDLDELVTHLAVGLNHHEDAADISASDIIPEIELMLTDQDDKPEAQ